MLQDVPLRRFQRRGPIALDVGSRLALLLARRARRSSHITSHSGTPDRMRPPHNFRTKAEAASG